ncbi:MAG TPA: beta-propeller fold lactonase family protein [Polyangiaceae bacterium]|nr:beta-propeller fold lactonase family protein [Polyangiaceae bacterium]
MVCLLGACSSSNEPQAGSATGGSASEGGTASGRIGDGSTAGSVSPTPGTAGLPATGGGASGGTSSGSGAIDAGGRSTGGATGSVSGGSGGSSQLEKAFVYLGGGQNGAGVIALYSLDYGSGELTLIKSENVGKNCSYLTLDVANHALFTTDDSDRRVRSLSINPTTWELAVGSERPSSGAPVHVAVTSDGKFVLTAQWIQGTIEAFRAGDGMLGTSLGSESACGQAHQIALAPEQDYVFVPCQTAGKINRYKFDKTTGALTAPTSTPTASDAGPRHLTFAPKGQFAYLVNEFDSTVYAYSYAAGVLTELQRVTALPSGFTGSSAGAEIAVVPSGKYVYASNRPKGQDGTIAQFLVGPDGKLIANGHQATGGQTPRSFAVDPTGRFLIVGNVDSNSVATLAIDDATGKLGTAMAISVGFSPWTVGIVVP